MRMQDRSHLPGQLLPSQAFSDKLSNDDHRLHDLSMPKVELEKPGKNHSFAPTCFATLVLSSL